MAQGKIALILVDIQNDFLEKGSLAVANSNSILKPVIDLITKVKCKQGLVVATQDWHPSNHISFASNNSDKQPFETKDIEYDGNLVSQVMWPDHCVQGTFGAEISDKISLDDIDYVVQKGTNPRVDSYSGFADNNYSEITQLAKILYQNHIDTVIVVGLAADYCVKETCLDSVKFGFKTILAIDATKPVDSNQLEATLSQLKSKGVLIQL
ncbi:Isochorismatase-like protein [Mucor mucedo]|uniref:Isochorismatase-like protein n=1 Tax=Mucor mucedo TaxID=29922 RepID=UPI002220DEB3|nr:Isochorismatase-like protein [Mucor mucedo]KAI7866943.1 Isochorismatase-like protein [Mucor mucedo]